MVIYLQFIIIIKYYLPKLTHQNEDGFNFIFYIYYTVKPPKRPPKMQRLGSCLWEVVAYESQTTRAEFLKFNLAWNGILIYSKKYWKLTFPCQILVVLLTKWLAILCDSSFMEVELIR